MVNEKDYNEFLSHCSDDVKELIKELDLVPVKILKNTSTVDI